MDELAALEITANSGDAASWIRESNALAKSQVHTYEGFPCKVGKNKIRLTKDYDEAGSALVATQLATAGKRLASVLNEIYK